MSALHDTALVRVIELVAGLLVIATIVGRILAHRAHGTPGEGTIRNLNARVNAWWVMCAFFTVATLTGGIGSIVLFGLVSFLALREFLTLSPTARADHHALFWVFFVVTPLQYALVAVRWYGLFSIMIPVYGFVFVTIRMALSGDSERFLERAASVQWALLACVYCVSYAPALVTLDVVGEHGGAKLLLFLVIAVQGSDVAQYCVGKLIGRTPVAPHLSPNKTREGLIGGIAIATWLAEDSTGSRRSARSAPPASPC